MLFFMGVMGLSLVLTVLYSVSSSIWLCVVFHSLSNTSYALGFDVKHNDTTGLIIQNSIPVVIGALMMLVYLTVRNRKAANTGHPILIK
jgi:membrane protease YdiL (CAAX protease family)